MPRINKTTTLILGEGPTEFFYLNSLKDEFRQLQNIKPDQPKNTSLRELERAIESAISMGYDRIFCLIDMDTKKKDSTSWQDYTRLKSKFHGKKVEDSDKGIRYEVRFFETDRCSELFFLYYFRYTGQNYLSSKAIEDELTDLCGYEKSCKFFKGHPLHQFFTHQKGDFFKAIEHSLKSEKSVTVGERDYTYSELGSMFRELGILEHTKTKA